MSDDRLTLNTEDERERWWQALSAVLSSPKRMARGAFETADHAVRAYRQRLPSHQQAESMCAEVDFEDLDERGYPEELPYGSYRPASTVPEQDDGTPTGPGWWWVRFPDCEWGPAYVVHDGGLAVMWPERLDTEPLDEITDVEWGGRCVRGARPSEHGLSQGARETLDAAKACTQQSGLPESYFLTEALVHLLRGGS